MIAVPIDNADIEETPEVTEDADSVDPRRFSCSSGLRGGKDGEG